MTSFTRRKLITAGSAALAVAISGCSGDDNQSDSQPRELDMLSGEYEVPEDEHVVTPPLVLDNNEGEISYDVTVTNGPDVDVYLLTSDNVSQYENGESFDYLSHTVGWENTVTGSATIERDVSIHILIDNTEVGDVSPPTNFDDDVATVELATTYSSN